MPAGYEGYAAAAAGAATGMMAVQQGQPQGYGSFAAPPQQQQQQQQYNAGGGGGGGGRDRGGSGANTVPIAGMRTFPSYPPQ